MASLEDVLFDLLAPSLRTLSQQGRELTAWWRRDGNADESLVNFLVRQGVLMPEAPRIIDLVGKGFLRPSPHLRVLRREGVARIRQHLDRLPAADPADTWPPPVGTVLGKYLLLDEVGRGTSGAVFHAINQPLQLPVAIKLFRPETVACHAGLRARLRAEARLLGQLNHPNVIRLWDGEPDAEVPYLVMEYIKGPSLAALIQQSGRVAVERAVPLLKQVLRGLTAIWRRETVHRDVKPGNILLSEDGVAKVADLGVALVTDTDQVGPPGGGRAAVVGTAAYMAPEQAMAGNEVDWHADVYSLGATFYHAVAGVLPHQASSFAEMLCKHAHETPRPPHLLVAGLPTAVSDVLLAMMAHDPEDRYPSVAHLFAALDRLPGGTTAVAPARKNGPFWRAFFSKDAPPPG